MDDLIYVSTDADDWSWLEIPFDIEEPNKTLGTDKNRREIRRCLIAESLYVNAHRDVLNGSVYSIDKLRFDLRIDPEDFDKAVGCWTLPRISPVMRSNVIGNYRELRKLAFDKSSIGVGIGHNGKGKFDARKGFVEYNPNKLSNEGLELIQRLLDHGAKLSVARYDLAVDFPVERSLVRVAKDKRMFESFESFATGSLTEYLGRRNVPGRVKVYDKQAESHLDKPLTRVELTCKGDWDARKVLGKLPCVFGFDSVSFDGLQRMTKMFAMSVQRNIEHGDTLEECLVGCDSRTRKVIREAFTKCNPLKYDIDCIKSAMNDTKLLCKGKRPGI